MHELADDVRGALLARCVEHQDLLVGHGLADGSDTPGQLGRIEVGGAERLGEAVHAVDARAAAAAPAAPDGGRVQRAAGIGEVAQRAGGAARQRAAASCIHIVGTPASAVMRSSCISLMSAAADA